MQDLVPLPGIEPGPPAQSLTHWTPREVHLLLQMNLSAGQE